MNIQIRKCVVCNAEIEISSENYGKNCHNNRKHQNKGKSYPIRVYTSDEGVCWNKHWFCNKDWQEIINYYKRKHEKHE